MVSGRQISIGSCTVPAIRICFYFSCGCELFCVDSQIGTGGVSFCLVLIVVRGLRFEV